MAIIYWKLGHLTAEGFQRPLDAYLVFQDGRVFDVDSSGWDRGIRPGDVLAEMKWRHPGATWVPWRPDFYQKSLTQLQEWLSQHAAAFEQTDLREGWWEWPRLNSTEWRRLVEEVVPRWAQRFEAGAASHPWMAHWLADAGSSLKVPVWEHSFGRTYVLGPNREEQFWLKMPLRYVEGTSQQMQEQWRRRHFQCVGDVPGLLSRIRQEARIRPVVHPPHTFQIVRRFDDPIREGLGDILANMAEEVLVLCRQSEQGVRFLRLTWLRPGGMERREREWPKPAGDAKAVSARVLSLLNHPPSQPFDEVQLEVRLDALTPEQMEWWDMPRVRPQVSELAGLMRFKPSRRELLLQHWDLWRMAGRRG